MTESNDHIAYVYSRIWTLYLHVPMF